ncbi:cpar-1, partial [Symbiodinium sp. CCMP2456]
MRTPTRAIFFCACSYTNCRPACLCLVPSNRICRPCVETTAEEKRQLLLPAAEPAPNEVRAREVAFALRATPEVNVEEEPDSPEDAGGPQSLTELANQLFGVAELEEASQRTESTEIPSPLAAGASTALSEHSEALEAPAPSSGLRLLQQRRRERAEAAPRAAGSAEAATDGDTSAGN